jgi:hypothetical protein
MDGCGLITTDVDQLAAGIKPDFLHGGSPLLFELSDPIRNRVGQVNRHLSTFNYSRDNALTSLLKGYKSSRLDSLLS